MTSGTCAVGESSVTLLHPPLPLAGVSIGMERECQQNDRTLANGWIVTRQVKKVIGMACFEKMAFIAML